jgi:hypothetical protein
VALAHYSLLAASLPTAQFCGNSHGLSTFDRLAEDALDPAFKSLVEVCERDCMLQEDQDTKTCTRVNVVQLRRALDGTAEKLWHESQQDQNVGRVRAEVVGA